MFFGQKGNKYEGIEKKVKLVNMETNQPSLSLTSEEAAEIKKDYEEFPVARGTENIVFSDTSGQKEEDRVLKVNFKRAMADKNPDMNFSFDGREISPEKVLLQRTILDKKLFISSKILHEIFPNNFPKMIGIQTGIATSENLEDSKVPRYSTSLHKKVELRDEIDASVEVKSSIRDVEEKLQNFGIHFYVDRRGENNLPISKAGDEVYVDAPILFIESVKDIERFNSFIESMQDTLSQQQIKAMKHLAIRLRILGIENKNDLRSVLDFMSLDTQVYSPDFVRAIEEYGNKITSAFEALRQPKYH